jgi:tRNA(Ile)-lysidine synthase TilS/MesJ
MRAMAKRNRKKKKDPISFTLKVVESDRKKLKLQLDFTPFFSNDFEPQIQKTYFNANRVRNILNYIANDVIPKVIESLNKPNFADYYKKRKGLKPGSTEYLAIEAQIREQVERIIQSKQKIDSREEKITSITFEKLSPETLVYTTESLANGDTMPPGGGYPPGSQ